MVRSAGPRPGREWRRPPQSLARRDDVLYPRQGLEEAASARDDQRVVRDVATVGVQGPAVGAEPRRSVGTEVDAVPSQEAVERNDQVLRATQALGIQIGPG